MKALDGATIWLSQSARGERELDVLLKADGARIVAEPLIEIHPIGDAMNPGAILSLFNADWLVVTSVNTVKHFLVQVQPRAVSPRVAAVGAVTARAVRDCGWRPEIVGTDGGVSLAQQLIDMKAVVGRTFFYPCAQIAPDELPRMLKTNGAAAVIRHPVYATTPPSQFNAQSVCHSDIVVLCSRSAADNLIRLHRDGVLSSLPAIVAIGSSTAAELRRQGIHHFETASQPTAAATAEAVFRLFARNQKRKHA